MNGARSWRSRWRPSTSTRVRAGLSRGPCVRGALERNALEYQREQLQKRLMRLAMPPTCASCCVPCGGV